MYLPLVGAVVGAVRENLHRYFYALGLQLSTGATANNRYFASLHQVWQHLDTCLYTNALAAPSAIHDGQTINNNPRTQSFVNVIKGPNKLRDSYAHDFYSWLVDDDVFSSVWRYGRWPHKPLAWTSLNCYNRFATLTKIAVLLRVARGVV